MTVYKIWEHQSLGNTIAIWDYEKHKIYGWKKGIKKGDKLQLEFKDGSIGEVEITDIEYENDPRDMFFGTIAEKGVYIKRVT